MEDEKIKLRNGFSLPLVEITCDRKAKTNICVDFGFTAFTELDFS